jgi:hypothetical protein
LRSTNNKTPVEQPVRFLKEQRSFNDLWSCSKVLIKNVKKFVPDQALDISLLVNSALQTTTTIDK